MTREESTQHLKGLLAQFKTLTKTIDDDTRTALFNTKPPLHDIVDTFSFIPKCIASLRWNQNRYIEYLEYLINYIEEHSK